MQTSFPRIVVKSKAKRERYLPRRSERLILQKKKLLSTYVRQIPTVLDDIPLCVISNEIFTFLDYESRINLNRCLPPWDRIGKKMNSSSIKKHQTNYCVKMADSILRSLDEREYYTNLWIYSGDKRIQRMIQLLNLFLKDDYFFIYTHFPGFRRVFSAKVDEMRESVDISDTLYSRIWIDELISTCDTVRDKILTSDEKLVDNYRLNQIPTLSFT